MLKSIKIRTPPETEFDREFWIWAAAWWKAKIDEIPERIRRERREIAYLSRTTGVQPHTLRRLLKILKMDPSNR